MRWSEAMATALYGPAGFYRRHGPAGHFRTSVNASPLFAEAVARLAARVDAALNHPATFDLADVGAGDGRLLVEVLDQLPHGLRRRTHALAVELRRRPDTLPGTVGWESDLPETVTGLVLANEWLDNIPCDVVHATDGRLREVLVDPTTGDEQLGGPASEAQLTWQDRWWPGLAEDDRCEVGTARDAAWHDVVGRLTRGAAVAIDYGHVREERESGLLNGGTLTGYRNGRQTLPVPDGTCDITAHVAFDSCAAAGRRAGAESTTLLRQRDALDALGPKVAMPSRELAHRDPVAYVGQLSRAGEAAELRDPRSLGGFWWLVQTKRCEPLFS